MNAIRFYNPFVERSLVSDLFRNLNVNDSFDSFYCGCVPANVSENEKDFTIELSVPGYSKEEIRIQVEKNMLTIRSEKKENQETQGKTLVKEFTFRSFERKFILPKSVNADQITAVFNNGILEVLLPKKEEVAEKAPVEIEIQ
jgi:HSP20 family protein